MTARALDVDNPRMSALLGRLDRGERVAVAKRTHGIWDHLGLLLAGGWTAQDWRRCDLMILKGAAPSPCLRDEYRAAYLAYLREILHDISAPPRHPGWYSTISLDLDYQTRKLEWPRVRIRVRVDPRLLSYWEYDYTYDSVVDHARLEEQDLHFAQLFTRAVVDQSILDLPAVARQFHVVTYGPAKLRDLADRWKLEPGQVTSIDAPVWPSKRPDGSISTDPVLPALQTYLVRHSVLDQLLEIQSPLPKLYLFEAGTVSQWLIQRLWQADSTSSMLDMGRTLELWYPEFEWPLKSPTARVYRRAARSYYGERRFQQIMGHR